MSLAWHERIVKVLKANEVRLVTYIPDNVLAPLISAVHADAWFKVICPAREEEAAVPRATAHHAPPLLVRPTQGVVRHGTAKRTVKVGGVLVEHPLGNVSVHVV